VNPDRLTVTIDDRRTVLATSDGGSHSIPVGPASLVDDVFERRDPPATAQLTNALGVVHDHLDDVLIEAPAVAATAAIVFDGHHATSLARVEIGSVELPDTCRIGRAAIDEVFRTIVAERPAERRHNPGLDDDHLDTIVATCCIVLAIMRRLALHDAVFADAVPPESGRHDAGHVADEDVI
jgi:exopolyphosphatase/pppGpp-phosphohydrolase